MSLRWILVDLNSYFASVEQQLNPKLRGKPVAVVPMMSETTSCIAASYEAKAFGIKTGTLVSEARELCPGIHLIEAKHDEYVRYHERIIEAIESCLPIHSVLSIDEVACRLRGRDQVLENAQALSYEIKAKIRKVGSVLGCSIGIAPNRFLAKVASDMQKPDGLVVLDGEDIPDRLFPLKLKDLPGIGHRMEARLFQHGIRTIQQLCSRSEGDMRKLWGNVGGARFYHWLRGADLHYENAFTTTQQKSISQSHVLSPDLRTEVGSYSVGQKLIQKAAIRLRKLGLWAGGLGLYVRYLDHSSWEQSSTILECQDTLSLLESFRSLWEERKRVKPKNTQVLKIGIVFFHLVQESERTFSFLEPVDRLSLSKTMDAINKKYGRDTVYFAGTHLAKSAAPTRIAFSNIPDLEI